MQPSDVLLEHTIARFAVFANVNRAFTIKYMVILRNIFDRKPFQKTRRKGGGLLDFSYRESCFINVRVRG